MIDIVFSYGLEPVLFQRILIGFDEYENIFLFKGKGSYSIVLWWCVVPPKKVALNLKWTNNRVGHLKIYTKHTNS